MIVMVMNCIGKTIIKDFYIDNHILKKLKLTNTEKIKTDTQYIFISKKDYVTLSKFKEMNDSVSKEYIENKFFLIESLYREQYSPYPGKLSYKIGCPNEFFPVKTSLLSGDDSVYTMKLKATKRYTYGGCTDESNYYYSYLIYFLCKKNNLLIELNYFTPIKKPTLQIEKLIENCKCKD